MDDSVVGALGLVARGRVGDALAGLRAAPGTGGRLRRELAEHLAARHDGQVYEDPAAFQAFVDGGGNVELYRAAVARLAGLYGRHRVRTVLDVGCGDGRVVVPAAVAAGPAPSGGPVAAGSAGPVTEVGERAPELDLVEPSEALLADATAAARAAGLTVRAHHGTVQDLLGSGARRRWDLVESTFALHAIEPSERTEVLAALRGVADTIAIVEFDVPAFEDGSPAHLAHLADRYEHGVAEYDGSLVAQGFLMPVLVGQVSAGRTRHTWEQPASAWSAQLTDAGWRDVGAAPLADYWWAPAILITATAGGDRG